MAGLGKSQVIPLNLSCQLHSMGQENDLPEEECGSDNGNKV